MNRTLVYGALLVALGVAVGVSLGWRGERNRVEPAEGHHEGVMFGLERNLGAGEIDARGARPANPLERRLDVLAAKLAAEADQRRRLEQRLEALTTELAALHGSGHEAGNAAASKPAPVAATPALEAATGNAVDPVNVHDGMTAMGRALLAAGIDATTAAEIRRRRDELSLAEIYLRDQATREGWLDTPRFGKEMAEIDRQRTSIRDEIGDEAYDRYLTALDQPNRVAVDEVMLDSPAALAGLQAGDVVLRYGETRIFSPNELVTATRGGTAGENVEMEIIRQGQRVRIDVARGPLGVTIAASRGVPGEG